MNILNLFSFSYGDFSKFENISLDDFKKSQKVILGHFTTSAFLNDILQQGLLPPKITNKFSNDDMFSDGDENYIYLTSHFDTLFSNNAAEKYGGKPILLLVQIDPYDLELDNLFNRHIKQGFDLRDLSKIFEELQNIGAAQARVSKKIPPEDIIDIIDIETKQSIKSKYITTSL